MLHILLPLAIAWLFIQRAPRWESRCGRAWRRGDMWEPVGFPPEPMEQRREPQKAEGTAAGESGRVGEGRRVFQGGRRFGRIRNPQSATGLPRTQ